MIDTHFHLMQAGRPGKPDSLEHYLDVMQTHGISRGIVVQPSSHRFDPIITLSAVKQYPHLFKAVVAVPPSVRETELKDLLSKGVVGIRLNLLDNPDQRHLPDSDFLKAIRDSGLYLQVYSEGELLARLVELAITNGVSLVVDHLGKPDLEKEANQIGFNEMLAGARQGSVLVKLSAPFRIDPKNESYQAATAFARHALDQVSLAQFVLGTDWPFIRCPNPPSVEAVMEWFQALFSRESDYHTVMENGWKLWKQVD